MSRMFLFYALVVAVLSVGLVILQHFCMRHQEGDFITSYCLTDTHMRTVIAAILTLMGLALTAAVTSAVEAYRCTQLVTGINEGVYNAMAVQSLHYLWRAMRTSWAPVMLVIVLAVNAPQSLQTLANLGIKSAGVYVQNRSTATVFNTYSYYNATITDTNFAMLSNAFGVLTRMRDYRTSSTSRRSTDGREVVTSVLRDGYLGVTSIRDNDLTNAFKRLETVVSVSSSCTATVAEGLTVSAAVPFNPASVNVTYIDTFNVVASASVYTLLFDSMRPDGSIYFNSTLDEVLCVGCTTLDPDTVVNSSSTNCASTVLVQDQYIIYTVGADSVEPVQLVSTSTTVSVPDLANLMVGFADSVEGNPEAEPSSSYSSSVFQFYSQYPAGPFNYSSYNVLHTKLCASASLVLSLLWSNYGQSGDAGAAGSVGFIGNAFNLYDDFVPLYNIVQLTYISTANIAAVVGIVTGCAALVSLLGMAFAITSRINIKPATDSSLLYNADNDMLARKRDFSANLSNDPSKQRDLEFQTGSMLYCRDVSYQVPSPTQPYAVNTHHHLEVCSTSAGEVPSKSQPYC